MTNNRLFKLMLGLFMACLFVWLIGRQLRFEALLDAFSGTTATWVLAGLAAFAIDYACRIARWHLMLARDNSSLTWLHCAGPFMSSFAANNVLPFRAGDALRAFAFNRQLGVSSGIVVATLFVERLLDLLMVLILFGSAILVFGLRASTFTGIGAATLFVVALGILTLLLLPSLFAPLANLMGKIAERVAPRFAGQLRHEVDKSLSTLSHLAQGEMMLKLVAWSIVAWLAEGGVFWCASMSLPSIENSAAAWLALPIGTLATLIPSTPGYVGTFDYFTVQAMTAFGNDIPAATAFALLVHTMFWLPPTLTGGLYLLLRPANTKDTNPI